MASRPGWSARSTTRVDDDDRQCADAELHRQLEARAGPAAREGESDEGQAAERGDDDGQGPAHGGATEAQGDRAAEPQRGTDLDPERRDSLGHDVVEARRRDDGEGETADDEDDRDDPRHERRRACQCVQTETGSRRAARARSDADRPAEPRPRPPSHAVVHRRSRYDAVERRVTAAA